MRNKWILFLLATIPSFSLAIQCPDGKTALDEVHHLTKHALKGDVVINKLKWHYNVDKGYDTEDMPNQKNHFQGALILKLHGTGFLDCAYEHLSLTLKRKNPFAPNHGTSKWKKMFHNGWECRNKKNMNDINPKDCQYHKE